MLETGQDGLRPSRFLILFSLSYLVRLRVTSAVDTVSLNPLTIRRGVTVYRAAECCLMTEYYVQEKPLCLTWRANNLRISVVWFASCFILGGPWLDREARSCLSDVVLWGAPYKCVDSSLKPTAIAFFHGRIGRDMQIIKSDRTA